MKEHRHGEMIAGHLRRQAQDDTGGLRATKSLLVLSYCSSKNCSLGSWVKSVWGMTRRTEIKYLVYVKHSTGSKLRCNVEL